MKLHGVCRDALVVQGGFNRGAKSRVKSPEVCPVRMEVGDPPLLSRTLVFGSFRYL